MKNVVTGVAGYEQKPSEVIERQLRTENKELKDKEAELRKKLEEEKLQVNEERT